ncbi:MAG TPA: hypothetical protein VJ656_03060 [Pyrinomonadaceae bacterium]|nr:hypothetical protein [Pyrinomonadaceae bacterium]
MFASLFEHEPLEDIACTANPTPPVHAEVTQATEPEDPNDKFRIIPEEFAQVDFGNWQYGPVALVQGEYESAWKEGGGETFSLKDVFYTDVTGDGKPEAIVNLSYLQCGGSCDGGSDLFYVYQKSKTGVRKIWTYETGSMAYGCGLKSFTIRKKQIAIEMFGHCWESASSFETSGKFMVRDVTRSVFHFNGKRFVKRLTEVTAAPIRDVKNYTPEVNIHEY